MYQIVTLTYPHIGNTGTNAEDEESRSVYAAGLIIRDLPLTGQPEVFLGNSPTLFDDNGQLIESARGFVQGYIDQLVALIEKNPK